MSKVTRGLGLAGEATRELGMLLPRTVAGLNESTGWAPASPRGVRQFGEVMLDELVLSGFSLLGGIPTAMRPLAGCTAAAEELSALGIDRAHGDPAPLRATSVRRRRVGNLAYERM
ncbi:MAG: alpha/beta hydrolase, partial [Mycobacterium sp.]